jgi:hypothetical protein
MIITGIVLSLCLPILWFTMQGEPLPNSECGPPACPSPRIVWLYPLLVAIPQGAAILMWLAGISGILLTALSLLKRSPLVVRAIVVVIVLALAWYSFLYILVNGLSHPVFRQSDSITAHGTHYHLLEAKYPDGPSYEIVLACDALGVRCEELLVAGGLSGESVDFPAFVSQLPQP